MATTAKATCKEIMARLETLGKESHRKTYVRHGAPADRIFGVPIGELKPIQKQVKKDHELAKELFATGNGDAQYLAGLIADETRMTKRDLEKWLREAAWSMISGFTVPSLAAETPHAVALASKWIDARQEKVAAAGWATLSGYLSVTPDEEIDRTLVRKLLERVVAEIHGERNAVKDAMNSFVIAAGCFVAPLKKDALAAARKIGKVEVDHGETACKTQLATEYIAKVEKMGRIGKKRTSARC